MDNIEMFRDLTESYLRSVIGTISGSTIDESSLTTPFQELGIDSFHVLQIVKKLEEDFGRLPKTLLFENFNIRDLAHYFIDAHGEVLKGMFSDKLHGSEPKTEGSGEGLRKNSHFPSTGVTSGVSSCVDKGNQSEKGEPILISEKTAREHPLLGDCVRTLFDRYKNEGSVSRGTRVIAPNLFIGGERRGYFHYGRRNEIILAYAYTGPEDYFQTIAREIYEYCNKHNFELNLFSDRQLECIGDIACTATPFGAMQRIPNISNFSLKGNKMRRLRYQVTKFEKAGKCRTEEYRCGGDPEVDRLIAGIIDKWCKARTMVNPLIYEVREEIIAGALDSDHRIFLTWLNEELQNVILI
ncbi:MAG: DUF2156 domain-containing protein, partial [Chitinivibrionales bacterium]|nr:DUF2156 domain-containing protein [Chitinivibrionales bacterium]